MLASKTVLRLTLTLLGAFSMSGLLKVRFRRVLHYLIVTGALLVMAVVGADVGMVNPIYWPAAIVIPPLAVSAPVAVTVPAAVTLPSFVTMNFSVCPLSRHIKKSPV